MLDDLKKLYTNRFPENEKDQRKKIWKTLIDSYFSKLIKKNATVLDLGAGYCEFINNVKANKKYAVDLNPETKKFAKRDVEVFNCSSTKLPKKIYDTIDVVFASNFFEHLPSREDVVLTLSEVKKILKKNGLVIILHPNIRYLNGQYWDFLDHQLALTEKSLVEALELSNFKIIKVISKFLPYTTKSRIPKHPFLIRLYLKIIPLQLILGKQSLIVAQKFKIN